MKINLLLLFGFIVCSSAVLNAQGVKVTGKIADMAQKTLPGVGIIITNANDSTQKRLTTTDADGNFVVAGLRSNTTYKLKTSYLGFNEFTRQFDTKNNTVNIGILTLKPQSHLLNEVVVDGQKTPVVQKGDTTEMSASAYKVNVDATAQDLVQKMPGVTIENGTVKAHGEDIKRVLLDGKNYFGEDAAMALQNLPAEVVDKVQVYNKMSDQSEFTGFDDGNSSKVLNIITRADRRKGENGVFTGGTDFADKYQVSGRLNILRNNKKITLTGGANNINQQTFSTQDLLGVLGGGGGRGGRGGGGGGFIGRQSGINKPASIGLNYTNEISKKLTISGSYFFNMQDNQTNTITSSQNTVQFGDTINRPIYSLQNSVSTNKNYNHRFDMKLEYNIDSANSIIWSPRFSTQKNDRGSQSNSYLHNILPDTAQYNNNNSTNSSLGYNYTNDLTFRHKFARKGRTISLGTTLSGNLNDGDGLSNYFTHYINRPDSTLNQKSDSKTNGTSFSANLAYTEPIGKISLLQLGYNATFSKNHTDREVYNYDNRLDSFKLSENYSNVYKSNYNTQRAGLTYMIRSGDLIANAGIDYQAALLTADRTSPTVTKVNGHFSNFLPNAYMTYKITKRSNLRMFYRTSTNSPSVTDLQDVITKSGTLNFSQGNPQLEPQYSNNGVASYRYSNPDNFSNFSFTVIGNYTTKYIGTATFYPTKDSTITSGNSSDIVTSSGSLQKPVNFKDAWNGMIFVNYGFLFMPIKCNLNFTGRLIYSNSPGSINSILNTTSNYTMVGGLTIASNISKDADFLISYMGTRNISDVKYFGDITSLESKMGNAGLSTKTWNHTFSLTSTFTLWQRLVLQNTLSGIILTGYGSGYNQNYLLWNPSLSLKVFKNKAGQVKVSVFDALKQNQNISHNVSALSISDTRTNILQRFVLFSFTYTLRNYQANDGERHRDGFGPPPGMGGGRRFGGGPGGDF